jgi:hypothetical protein
LLKLLSCFGVCVADYIDACAGIETVGFSQNQLHWAWRVVLGLPTYKSVASHLSMSAKYFFTSDKKVRVQLRYQGGGCVLGLLQIEIPLEDELPDSAR